MSKNGITSQALRAAQPPSAAQRLQELQRQAAALQKEVRASADYAGIAAREDFIDNLYARMAERRVSRAELARRLGTSRAYVSKVLSGSENLTIDTMARLSRAVGCEVRFELCESAESESEFIRPQRLAHQHTIAESAPVLRMLRGGQFQPVSQCQPVRDNLPRVGCFTRTPSGADESRANQSKLALAA